MQVGQASGNEDGKVEKWKSGKVEKREIGKAGNEQKTECGLKVGTALRSGPYSEKRERGWVKIGKVGKWKIGKPRTGGPRDERPGLRELRGFA